MALPFDPRLAPQTPLPDVPPPVPAHRLHPVSLRERFARPPQWRPDVEVEPWLLSEREPVPAAVLVPLVVRAPVADVPRIPSVLLTQRTAHLKAHAGQISFPGGRSEPDDVSAVATALREAHEEVGLAPDRVEVLGQLPTYLTGTGFLVTPVVGLIEAAPHETERLRLQADPSEVDDIFEVPLDFLMDPRHHRRHTVRLGERELSYFAMPWVSPHRQEDYFIWGATAAMLRNFYRFLAA